MADPFLLAHSVEPFSFDIGGRLSPISIRDQMIRGRVIVDRALEEGLIDTRSRDLLVVGAGAAGATAAIRAAQQRVRTLFIDVAPAPFLRQGGCRSRWVDPVQYDWPVQHWAAGVYPWTLPAMPLPWVANVASNLALVWTGRLNAARMRRSNLIVSYSTTVNSVTPSFHFVGVQFNLPTGVISGPQNFGMMLTSVGFGTETTTVNQYTGFRFWDTEPFQSANLGLPPGAVPRVLISGGGDGALQDFLRIVTTSRSARDIWQSLLAVSESGQEQVWAAIEATIQSAEDQAQRAYIWGETSLHDHSVHDVLHRAHEAAVARLQGDSRVWSSISRAMGGLVREPAPRVKLVYRCTHFSKCYGLNRFLVLLVARYLNQNAPGVITLSPGVEVVDVAGAPSSGHGCANNPASCHGERHTITLRDADCRTVGSTTGLDDDEYNIVVIRHAIRPPTYVYGSIPVPQPRQMLPYHVAW